MDLKNLTDKQLDELGSKLSDELARRRAKLASVTSESDDDAWRKVERVATQIKIGCY